MGNQIVRINNLVKFYGSRPALQNLNLNLTDGKVVGLMGENGCGKTTLLKILAGIMCDYSGIVEIVGHKPGVESKQQVAFLPDESHLPDAITARSAIALYSDFFTDFDAHKALEMLNYFGLEPSQRYKEMSKGMREKLQIALTMARSAKVYLLDEPISGVDPASRSVIMDGIIKGFSQGALMLVSTHLIQDIETVVDEAVFMYHGQVVMHRQADEIRENEGKSLDRLFREMFACSPHS
ncbi:MAG: ABC transporter ATP-binding protein [Actinomycetaceae bacterium]|nr:ABC transporter ATP-binding protein [Actinomycetaceae bacterium]